MFSLTDILFCQLTFSLEQTDLWTQTQHPQQIQVKIQITAQMFQVIVDQEHQKNNKSKIPGECDFTNSVQD